jgi:molybdopterin/thiamine biosynthesis adenylyltransferase/DNA-directed RNA polymerase subunit RPC12/RpoP
MSELKEKTIEITDPEQDRYSTLHLIDWWDQRRLAESRVMVIGAGALGNEVIKNCALLGVGHIFVVDFDKIEASNLSRAVLFREEDYGLFKAEAIARRVNDLNPHIRVTPLVGDINRDLGLGLYRQMDVIIGCLDNREARMAVNRACWRTGKPWIDGGLGILDGVMRVFQPPDGACYECAMTDSDYELINVRYSCPAGQAVAAGREPTTATTASIIAAMQAQEAIKLLHGLPVVAGRGVYYSGQTLRITYMNYSVREDCPAHQSYGEIIELPYRVSDMTVNDFLKHTGGDLIVLDDEILTQFVCPFCHQSEAVYRPYYQVVDDISCPNCGQRRLYDVVSSLSASEQTVNLSLSSLGVPAYHILPVRFAEDWKYFEFSGDGDSFGLMVEDESSDV